MLCFSVSSIIRTIMMSSKISNHWFSLAFPFTPPLWLLPIQAFTGFCNFLLKIRCMIFSILSVFLSLFSHCHLPTYLFIILVFLLLVKFSGRERKKDYVSTMFIPLVVILITKTKTTTIFIYSFPDVFTFLCHFCSTMLFK